MMTGSTNRFFLKPAGIMTKNKPNIVVPKTIEEFYNSDWLGKLYTTVFRFRLPEESEETVQHVLLKLIKFRFFERYDPDIGAFSTWFYGTVINILKSRRTYLLFHPANQFNNKALRLDRDNPENERSYTSFRKSIPDKQIGDSSFLCIIKEIREALDVESARLTNNLNSIFSMLLQGNRPCEISRALNISHQGTYNYIMRIRKICLKIMV